MTISLRAIILMRQFCQKKMGKRFQQIRESKGLPSGRQFCEDYDEIGESWGKWEKGEKDLYVTNFGRICLKFDVSPTWLMFGKGPMKLSEMKKES